MNRDLQKYYEDYFAMFATDGWKQLMDEVDNSLDTFRIENITDERELYFVKGQMNQLRSLKGLQMTIEAAYEELESDS